MNGARIPFEEFTTRWAALHGDVPAEGVVLGWLKVSYRVAGLLARARIGANHVSLAALALSIAFWGAALHPLAFLLLVASLICDGVDGSLALITRSESLRGAMVDSVSDRLAELFWALALIRIGAPVWLALALLVTSATQEYVRARLRGLGDFATGVVTLAERPHRVIYLALTLVSFHITGSATLFQALLAVTLMLQVNGLMSVMRDAYAQIRAKDSLSN